MVNELNCGEGRENMAYEWRRNNVEEGSEWRSCKEMWDVTADLWKMERGETGHVERMVRGGGGTRKGGTMFEENTKLIKSRSVA